MDRLNHPPLDGPVLIINADAAYYAEQLSAEVPYIPADDRLWDTPRLLITPHLGGESDRYADQVLPVILHNTRCAQAGDWAAMRNRVSIPG